MTTDPKIKIELTRLRVREGKERRVDDWLSLLRDHMPEVLLTLDDENMHVETVFRETQDGRDYLYWYSRIGQNDFLPRTILRNTCSDQP